jgi:hypothetical protein
LGFPAVREIGAAGVEATHYTRLVHDDDGELGDALLLVASYPGSYPDGRAGISKRIRTPGVSRRKASAPEYPDGLSWRRWYTKEEEP